MQREITTQPQAVPDVPTWTPPAWLNRMMIWFLKTPLLEKWIGRSTALITFKGRRSGKRYTTPVTYVRTGDEVIILSKRFRVWWRNLIDIPKVALRLAGDNVLGVAEVMPPDDDALDRMIEFLDIRKRDARAYGLSFDEDGRLDRDEVRAILPQIVVVRVKLAPKEIGT